MNDSQAFVTPTRLPVRGYLEQISGVLHSNHRAAVDASLAIIHAQDGATPRKRTLQERRNLYLKSVGTIFDSNTVKGNVLYSSATDHVGLARHNGTEAQAKAIGVAADDVTAGDSGELVSSGNQSLWTGLTPGATYFVGALGAVTATRPVTGGQYVTVVGVAVNATTIAINLRHEGVVA